MTKDQKTKRRGRCSKCGRWTEVLGIDSDPRCMHCINRIAAGQPIPKVGDYIKMFTANGTVWAGVITDIFDNGNVGVRTKTQGWYAVDDRLVTVVDERTYRASFK